MAQWFVLSVPEIGDSIFKDNGHESLHARSTFFANARLVCECSSSRVTLSTDTKDRAVDRTGDVGTFVSVQHDIPNRKMPPAAHARQTHHI